jgi:membrane protein required for colicin V production
MGIDIIFLMAAGYGFYVGYSRGIIQTLFNVLGYTLGLLAAAKFAPIVTGLLETIFDNHSPLLFLGGFLVSFIVVIFIVRFLSSTFESLLELAHINILNQVAGGVITAALVVLLYSVMLWFVDSSLLLKEETKEDSATYPFLKTYPAKAKVVGEKFFPIIHEYWTEAINLMDHLQKSTIENTESKTRTYDIEETQSEKRSSPSR